MLNVYWDDETEPSIQAPLGDFFGMGHGITKSFASAPLQITPEDGRGFNCWFPMPFRRRARFTVKNECCSPLHFYFYVDYEQARFPAGKHAVLPRALEPRMPDGRRPFLGTFPPYGMDHGR